MNFLSKTDRELGRVVSPGGGIRIIWHPDFIWYYDGEHSITFSQLLFKDGTVWRYDEPS